MIMSVRTEGRAVHRPHPEWPLTPPCPPATSWPAIVAGSPSGRVTDADVTPRCEVRHTCCILGDVSLLRNRARVVAGSLDSITRVGQGPCSAREWPASPLFLHVAEHHFGTRPRDGTGTLVPHHPHSTSCPGSRCAGMGMGFLDVSPCMLTRLLQAAASSSQRYVPPEMHRVCSRSPCSRYPSPRLARRVRDIGVGAGVGQWTQLEVDGVKELGAAGGEVRA